MAEAPRTLIIETATAACSVALLAGDILLAERHEVVGRGHAERLIPMIAELPGGGRADAILVDVGPGSFTGVRVGLAAARGLAIGWGVPVRGYSSMALLAAAAFAAERDLDRLAVVLEGGHGEVFVQHFTGGPLLETGPLASLVPEAALQELDGRPAVGSGVRRLIALAGELDVRDALPRAADAVLLPPACTELAPRPLYGRAPDAKTLAERGLA
ncbi:tRNA (adenosine(37)-N6)-threonylcarbamoyltransferase complex dimerization subunit type 1 TsaB [Sphingomonas pokkalii]|uniref:tRNA (Adenosine(37)-N6)-threonylcarbamoyltransferase complex dimerization subunit type 1 TsaB n=1 Tax=Sphingomonas pokkalii TaxID=2175090 RepID=A0A2U0SA34_9SPHN|nr:tRNA (adenosine(37)-N6)-threonylcarbamoyltransferase complex dimerization subunit type 1 TsaB [Sphingomonas pokkalii]PVX28145.1 tRNA (adenosine(37)-N6)-threonylcarbamoyltransferase complex dimerization subunit type 1 TsaB [Sphingomonas pokkalii]